MVKQCHIGIKKFLWILTGLVLKVMGILEIPHLTELWDLGDHQIRHALKRGKKVSKH
jgi:hypothetical protein